MKRSTQEGSPPLWGESSPENAAPTRTDAAVVRPRGLGPSRFRPAGEVPFVTVHAARTAAEFKAFVQKQAPRRPGVYAMLDGRGRVIYVGKAKRLRVRLLSYFRNDSRHPKAGRIIEATRELCWEETHDEFTALLRELELIRRFRPRFNVLGLPGPHRMVYLCLGRKPAPYAYLAREPQRTDLAFYGPFVGRGRLAKALRRLNDAFLLRDCSQRIRLAFADQPPLFTPDRPPAAQCLRHELGTCLGPCIAACTQADYAQQIRRLRRFLEGHDLGLLQDWTQAMQQAARELRFEKAQSLKDRLQPLQWLQDRLLFLRQARSQGDFVYPCPAEDGRNLWLLIHRGEVVGAVREPQSDASRAAARALLQSGFRLPAGESDLTERTVDSVLLLHAWFRKHPAEKAKLMTRAQAEALCADPVPALPCPAAAG